MTFTSHPHTALPLRFADDPEFLADLPYDPEVLFFDELSELDRDKSLVRCRMPTSELMPITRSQRAHPVLHPRHVAGAVMVHATGMLGFVHAYHVLGLRHRAGWIGYGTHIHRVVFRKLVEPGTPIDAVCQATRTRAGKERYIVRYRFEFKHEGALCYEGDQTAVWMRVDPNAPVGRGAAIGAGAETEQTE
jgi:hypothetical protein